MCVDSNYPGGLDVCGYTALGALMCCGYVTQEGHCKNDHISPTSTAADIVVSSSCRHHNDHLDV